MTKVTPALCPICEAGMTPLEVCLADGDVFFMWACPEHKGTELPGAYEVTSGVDMIGIPTNRFEAWLATDPY